MSKKFLAIIIVLFFILIVSTVIWLKWFFIPIPRYLHNDDKWKCIDKQTGRAWGRPWIYCRFKVDYAKTDVIEKLSTAISNLHEWERIEKRESEEIIAEIRKKWGKEIKADELDELLAKLIAPRKPEFALRTQKPFIVLIWSGHEGNATNHKITIRVIENNYNQCIVEVWDYRIFD